MSDAYYLWLNEQKQGPFSLGQLRSMWSSGQINLGTLYATETSTSWEMLATIQALLEDRPVMVQENVPACKPV